MPAMVKTIVRVANANMDKQHGMRKRAIRQGVWVVLKRALLVILAPWDNLFFRWNAQELE
jgi:hypothetical protein